MTQVKCTNCEWQGSEEELIICKEDGKFGDGYGFWGCPNCKTDAYLADVEPAPAKHTQGKWHASNLRIFANINGLDRRVAECYRPAISGEYDGGECEANARLIAAAPETAAERDRLREINKDLLEALTLRRMEDGYNASENKEELLAQIESRCRKHGYKGLESGDGIFLCEFIDTLCDAAIAKATQE